MSAQSSVEKITPEAEYKNELNRSQVNDTQTELAMQFYCYYSNYLPDMNRTWSFPKLVSNMILQTKKVDKVNESIEGSEDISGGSRAVCKQIYDKLKPNWYQYVLGFKGYRELSYFREQASFSDSVPFCYMMTECIIMVKNVFLEYKQTLTESITLRRRTQPGRPLKFGIRSCSMSWYPDRPSAEEAQSQLDLNEAERGIYHQMPAYYFKARPGVTVFIQKEEIKYRTPGVTHTYPEQTLVLDGFVTGEIGDTAIVIKRPEPMFLRM